MRKSRVLTLCLVALFLCGTLELVLAQQTPVPKKTTYRFATWVTPELQTYTQLAIKGFQRDFPMVKVDTEVTPFGSYAQKMLLDIAAGSAADVFQLSFGWTGNFVKQNALLDLKPILAGIAIPKGVTPVSEYSASAINALSYNGQLVGIPQESYAPVIIYNKSMFTKAGLPFPTADWTWADLKTIAKKLTIPNQQWAIYPFAAINYHSPLIEGNGGSLVGTDGRAVGALNGPKSLEAVRFVFDLFQSGVAPTPGIISSMGGNATPLLLTGKLAMILNAGIYIMDVAKSQGIDVEKEIGVVPPPRPCRITLGVHAYCVGRSESDKEAAALLALYLGGAQEVIDRSVTSYRAVPILSCQRQQLVLMPSLKTHYDSWMGSTGRAFTMDPSVDGVTLAEVYQAAFESAIAGKATLENALNKAAQDYDQRVSAKK
jgi:multiple sugar transport system substrate-binding protein